MVFALANQKRMQAVITAGTTERARKVLILNLVFQHRKHPVKREIASLGNQTIGVTILLIHLLFVVHLHGMARDMLPWWHQSLWTLFWIFVVHGRLDRDQPSEGSRNMHCTMALRKNFALVISPLCLPILRLEQVWKVVLFIIRQHPHVLPELMCLRRATCLSYSPFLQMKNLGTTIELDPRGDKITCPAFGLYSSPAENSTMGRIVLDLTCLVYQARLRERFTHPKRHVTCALSE